MPPQYANTQPQGFNNHIKNVAIVGAGGNAGSYIARALLSTNHFTLTALTRPDSTTTLPPGIHKTIKVSYTDHTALVHALTNQDALVITMQPRAPDDPQQKLIAAAAEAGVKWILPNEWGYDVQHPGLFKDAFVGPAHKKYWEQIEGLGVSSWIGVTCGFWYEWSLGGGEMCYGFDIPGRKVVFFDEGETRINTSTWPQVGRGVAELLSLPILPADENDKSACLSNYRNDFVRISSFRVNQKEMFESVLRVTGTKKEEWEISNEDSVQRYQAGVAKMQKGDMMGFAQAMYTRVFWKDGSGDFESSKGVMNGVLGLKEGEEDMDAFTKVAVGRAVKGGLRYKE